MKKHKKYLLSAWKRWERFESDHMDMVARIAFAASVCGGAAIAGLIGKYLFGG